MNTQRQTTTIHAINAIRNGIFSIAIVITAFYAISCNNDEDLLRKEFLVVSDTVTKVTAKTVECPFIEGKDTLYIYTNVDYDLFFETGDEDPDWITFEKKGYDKVSKAEMLIIHYAPMTKTFKSRSGTLSFIAPNKQLGAFVSIVQGYKAILEEDFDWLGYGSNVPFDEVSDKSIDNWSKAQIEKGWTSTLIEGLGYSPLYGKVGYVKLGDESNKGDLTTPLIVDIEEYPAHILRFKASAFTSDAGIKDADYLKVSIINGGGFFKEFDMNGMPVITKTQVIKPKYYNHADPEVATSMWQPDPFVFMILNTKESPITQHTKLVFTTANGTVTETANRIFLDNIHVYALTQKDLDVLLQPKY